MKKKRTVTKKPQVNAFVAKIKDLHACITKDQSELAKLYKKAVSDVEKKSSIMKKSLLKAKQTVTKASKNKKKSPRDHKILTSLFMSLKKGEALVKAEMEGLKIGYRNFLAQEKSRKQVDKLVPKTAKPASTSKRTFAKTASNRKKVRRTAAKTAILAPSTSNQLYKITE